MNYKDFSSPVIDRIREAGNAAEKYGETGFEPAEDLPLISFGIRREDDLIRSCPLLKHGLPAGVALGGFGLEDDPAILYLLLVFPAAGANYEIISYRYSRDKFFIFRDGKLIGQIRGDYTSDLDEVKKWEVMCGEDNSGVVPVPPAWSKLATLSAELADRQCDLEYKLFPPPRYRNWLERFLTGLSVGIWIPPLPPDPVLRGRPRFRSRTEGELYFCIFVFFRVMVFGGD